MTRTKSAAVLVAAALVAMLSLGSAASLRRTLPAEAADCNKIAFPATLQSLIDNARSRDIICVAAGVYRGPVHFDSKNGVTLRGMGARQTIVAGGDRDSMLIFNSRDLTFENFTLFYGHPSNAYISGSSNIVFRNMDVGGGGIGIHYDVGSLGTISDSFVYAMDGDAILSRRASNVTVERNWVFANGGVGVSTVAPAANTTVVRNIISDNKGPGVFGGVTPCALLPPGFVEVPDCYLQSLPAYVGDANVILDSNVIQANGSTGIVLFPGTRGTMRGNHVWRNKLTGLFAWGAQFSSEGDEYDGNEEHAIEARAYPDPLKYPQIPSSQRVRAVGKINNGDIHGSVVLAETGTLGGGVLAQGANLDVTNSRVHDNRGIGVSYVNTSTGAISNNQIFNNRGSGICIFRAGAVATSGNNLSGNVDNRVGVCEETTP